jgi:hypothetical protein
MPAGCQTALAAGDTPDGGPHFYHARVARPSLGVERVAVSEPTVRNDPAASPGDCAPATMESGSESLAVAGSMARASMSGASDSTVVEVGWSNGPLGRRRMSTALCRWSRLALASS